MTLQRAPAVPLSIARPWQPRVTCDGRGDGTARAGPRTVGLAGRHCPGRPRRSLQRASAFPLSTAQPWQPRMTCDGCGGDTAGAGTRTRTRGSTLSRADRPEFYRRDAHRIHRLATTRRGAGGMGRVTAAALPDVPCPPRTRQELIVAGHCLAGRRCCPGLRSSCAARAGGEGSWQSIVIRSTRQH